LINQKSEAFRFFLQFPILAELWQTHLGNHLTQLGFHEHYRVLDRIGKGSTSVVYKVQRISDSKIFAAKAFLKSFLASKP
jgi:serine/threonine protein kinase